MLVPKTILTTDISSWDPILGWYVGSHSDAIMNMSCFSSQVDPKMLNFPLNGSYEIDNMQEGGHLK